MTSRSSSRAPRLRLLASTLVITMASFVLVGCGSSSGSKASTDTTSSVTSATGGAPCPTKNAKSFAKTKFVLHTGLAFGAFHRYLYKPFKAGTFKKGASGRIRGFIKGGLAALFVKRQIRIASQDVRANPTLCKVLAKPLARFSGLITGLIGKVKGGDIASIGAAEQTLSTITSLAGSKGVSITEDPNPNLNG